MLLGSTTAVVRQAREYGRGTAALGRRRGRRRLFGDQVGGRHALVTSTLDRNPGMMATPGSKQS